MDFNEYIRTAESILKHTISDEQKAIVEHDNGPLWIIAGPGSGKSEVLVLRTLKLILVNNVNPKSIIITTFTEKAAKNLFNRILNYYIEILALCPEHTNIDIYGLRIGTLHSLCNDIMLEYKYPEYENYRLLDDIEQSLYIYEHSNFVRGTNESYLPLCIRLHYLFDQFDPITGSKGWSNHERLPNRWRRCKGAVSLFNRIVEDDIDLNLMNTAGEPWKTLLTVYNEYVRSLEENRRCDFAHLQRKFLDFLNSPFGSLFLQGNNSDTHPGIRHLMVDEYQDTNPIQEAIYFKIAENGHNICVVGDDDQALYRFRGGTVECMVNFDKKCGQQYGLHFDYERWQKFLSNNYRSHKYIVQYYDRYINSFEAMKMDGARVRGKPPLNAESSIDGEYPAVAFITGKTIEDTANKFAFFVRDLLKNNVIQNPNQCALLMKSVKESPQNALHFATALRSIGIMPYNPRSRTFLNQIEISSALGAFISIIDPGMNALEDVKGDGINDKVRDWVESYKTLAHKNQELRDYVNSSIESIRNKPRNTWVDVSILDIFYRILSHEPYITWKDDSEKSYRLGKLSGLFEAYSSIPLPHVPGSNRGFLKTSSEIDGQISIRWRKQFYYSLTGLLVSSGINDPENEADISPIDRLPIMTVHQAKGLEFDFVFVYGLNQSAKEKEATISLENDLAQFRRTPSLSQFNGLEKSRQDLIRFYFVAFSRAKYALIHLVPKNHFKNDKFGFIGKNTKDFRKNVKNLGA